MVRWRSVLVGLADWLLGCLFFPVLFLWALSDEILVRLGIKKESTFLRWPEELDEP